MKKLIDRLVERLYYKRFPDRVNDHKIATSINVVKAEEYYPVAIVDRYRPEKYIAEIHIPFEAKIPQEWIKKELSIKLARVIEDQLKIERELYPQTQTYIYRGYINILKEAKRQC